MIIVNHFLHTQKIIPKKVLRNYLDPLFHVWLRAFEEKSENGTKSFPKERQSLIDIDDRNSLFLSVLSLLLTECSIILNYTL